MTRSRRFFASSPWIATGTPDYVNLGYTSRGLAKQALMRLSRKSLAIFRKLGLVMHSEDDQIVPYVAAGPLSAKLLRNSTLKTYKDFPHGMPTTEADTINADLLAFLKKSKQAAA